MNISVNNVYSVVKHNRRGDPVSRKEIVRHFNVVKDPRQRQRLDNMINHLVQDGRIVPTGKAFQCRHAMSGQQQ